MNPKSLKATVVTLDLTAYDPSVIADRLRNAGLSELADQIEAQVKPPRIPEPGLWGVVEADTLGPVKGRQRFVRYGEHTERWAMEDGDSYSWDDLIDPTLIREGVES